MLVGRAASLLSPLRLTLSVLTSRHVVSACHRLTNPLPLGVTKPLGNQATGHASQHYSVPVPSRGKLGGLRQKGQWRDDGAGEGTHSPDGVASRRIVGTYASVIFPCTIKSRRWRAIMEEVDKGCRCSA